MRTGPGKLSLECKDTVPNFMSLLSKEKVNIVKVIDKSTS